MSPDDQLNVWKFKYEVGNINYKYLMSFRTLLPEKYETWYLVSFNKETESAMVCHEEGCSEKQIVWKNDIGTYKVPTFGINTIYHTGSNILLFSSFNTYVYKKMTEQKLDPNYNFIQWGGSQLGEVEHNEGKSRHLIYGSGMLWNIIPDAKEKKIEEKFLMNNAYDKLTLKDGIYAIRDYNGVKFIDSDINSPMQHIDYKTEGKDFFLYVKDFVFHQKKVLTTQYSKVIFNLNPPTPGTIDITFIRRGENRRHLGTTYHTIMDPKFKKTERILQAEDVILEETSFYTLGNLRKIVYTFFAVSITIMIIGIVLIVIKTLNNMDKPAVKLKRENEESNEEYEERVESKEREEDARYRANLMMYEQVTGNQTNYGY